ncbi:MAG TPA: hypothetical protein HA364_00385 [Thermoplasmata archaeon]|nr:hypothetical protein [Thermoplasmata archaeon]
MVLETLAALVLLGHGLGHTTGLAGAWSNIETGFSDKPWIFGENMRLRSPIGKVFGLVFLTAAMLFVISSVAAFTGSESWRTFALAGSIASIACMVPWWNTVIFGARLGVLLDIAIILVLIVPGGEPFVDFFGLP